MLKTMLFFFLLLGNPQILFSTLFPLSPHPYFEEEVSFENPKDGVKLMGTLTLPASKGPFPVVILLHGSAPLDRDGSLLGHKPFYVIADHFTKQGIAVLRFDKRGAGKSTGDYSVATIEDFASDALCGVAYLKTRKEINAKQIGLVGHSEGGMTAPLAASKSNDVAFIVLMAGPGVSWEEMMYTQIGLFQMADGASQKTINLSQELVRGIFGIIKKQQNRDAAAKDLHALLTGYLGKLTPPERKAYETYYGPIDEQAKFFNAEWFRYYVNYRPDEVLKQVKIPVLALNGDLDMNVSSRQNLPVIDKALRAAGNKDYTIVELPKINHLFQTCVTGSVKEYPLIKETISPVVLDKMSEWILDHTSRERE